MIITIAGQAGSGAVAFAQVLSQKLGYELLTTKKILHKFLTPIAGKDELLKLSLSPKYYLTETSAKINFRDYLTGILNELASHTNYIMLGNAGAQYLHDNPHALHLFFIADDAFCLEQLGLEQYRLKQTISLTCTESTANLSAESITESSTTSTIYSTVEKLNELTELNDNLSTKTIQTLEPAEIRQRLERKYRRYSLTLFHHDFAESTQYHALYNLSKTSIDTCIAMVKAMLDEYRTIRTIQKPQYLNQEPQLQVSNLPDFKNSSERELAEILDMYQIDWRYEPRFFPVEWDQDNNVTLAFAPDFYLPKFNLYLELTTMNQKYVSLKKKKLRLLNELYPDVNVKILYKRDFQSLIERFN